MSPTPSASTTQEATARTFTHAEEAALDELRARYQASRDVFGAQELARLQFVRWLYQTGRLES